MTTTPRKMLTPTRLSKRPSVRRSTEKSYKRLARNSGGRYSLNVSPVAEGKDNIALNGISLFGEDDISDDDLEAEEEENKKGNDASNQMGAMRRQRKSGNEDNEVDAKMEKSDYERESPFRERNVVDLEEENNNDDATVVLSVSSTESAEDSGDGEPLSGSHIMFQEDDVNGSQLVEEVEVANHDDAGSVPSDPSSEDETSADVVRKLFHGDEVINNDPEEDEETIVSTLKDDICDMITRFVHLEGDLKDATDVSHLGEEAENREVADERAQIANLKDKEASLQETVGISAKLYAELEEDNNNLYGHLDELTADNKDLATKLECTDSELLQAQDEINNQKARISNLESSIRTITSKRDAASTQVIQLSKNLEGHEATMSKVTEEQKATITKMTEENEVTVTKMSTTLEANLESARRSHKKEETRLAEYSKCMVKLTQSLEEATRNYEEDHKAAVTKMTDEHKATVTDMETSVATATEEHEAIVSKMTEEHEATVAKITEEHKVTETDIEVSAMGVAEELKATMSKMAEEHKVTVSDMEASAATTAVASESLVNDHEAQVNALEEEKDVLEEDKAGLKVELDTVREKHDAAVIVPLQETVRFFTKIYAELEEENNNLHGHLDELTADKKGLVTKLERTDSELLQAQDEARNKNAKLESSIKSITSERDAANTQVTALFLKSKNLEMKLTEVTSENKKLGTEKEEAVAKSTELEESVSTLQDQTRSLLSKNGDLTSQINEAFSKCNAMEVELNKSIGDVSRMVKEKSTTASELDDSNVRHIALHRQRNNLYGLVKERDTRVNALKKVLDVVEEEKVALKVELDTGREKYEAAVAMIMEEHEDAVVKIKEEQDATVTKMAEEHKVTVGVCEKRHKDETQSVTQLKQETESLRLKLEVEQMTTSRIVELLREDETNLGEENTTPEEEKVTLQKEHDTIRVEREDLSKMVDELYDSVSSLEREKTHLKEQLNEAKAQQQDFPIQSLDIKSDGGSDDNYNKFDDDDAYSYSYDSEVSVESLMRKIQNAESEKKELKTENDKLENLNSSLEQKIEQQKLELGKVYKDIDDMIIELQLSKANRD